MLSGNTTHQVDIKGRIKLPEKFRPILGSEFIISHGIDGCLFLYPKSKLIEINEKSSKIPIAHPAQKALRAFISSVHEVVEDTQGRFVIPQQLREKMNIEKEVVIVGVIDRAEIWTVERYKQTVESMSPDEALQALEEFWV